MSYEKFLPHIVKVAEAVNPGGNWFVVLGASGEVPYDVPLVSSRLIRYESQQIGPEAREHLADCDALFVHPLNAASAEAVKAVHTDAVVVWCGMGIDFYRYAPAFRAQLLMPHTQRAQSMIAFRQAPLSAIKSKAIGGLRKYLRPNAKDPVADAVSKVDFFAAHENGLDLKKTLGGFRAEQVDSFGYYALEDALTQGADPVDGKDILIGNSATWSNNHFDLFEQLRGLDLEDRQIVMPLSYGGADSKQVGDAVVQRAHDLFGRERVVALRDWMSVAEYNRTLSRCSTVFMNHTRGQAMGNICSMLIRGARVYLRPENPYVEFIEGLGVRLDRIGPGRFDANVLAPLEDEERARNAEILQEHWAWPAVSGRTARLFDRVALERERKRQSVPVDLVTAATNVSKERELSVGLD